MRVDDLLLMCLLLFEFYEKEGMMITIFKFVGPHQLPTVATAIVVASQTLLIRNQYSTVDTCQQKSGFSDWLVLIASSPS
jgi:hypothetical protein